MAEFDPRQLDQLEDALEQLADHDDHDLEALELPAEVTERLSEYQDVLALCRDAFPLESPPDGLLTGVIAEAREVSRRPRARSDQRTGWGRFWERWRGTLVPGFALATTAVVVLWVLDPEGQLEQATELAADEADDEADGSSGKAELGRSQPASESSKSDATDMPEQLPQPITQPATKPDEQREDPSGTAPVKSKPSGAGKPTKSKIDDSYEPMPEPAPAPMNKDETWTTLERADAARRTGNCDRARSLYDEVIAASSDSLAIAQAKGGIGLCFEQDRRNSDAAKWFEDARAASPGIDAWINGQRDEQPLPGETKKPRSKKDMASEVDAL